MVVGCIVVDGVDVMIVGGVESILQICSCSVIDSGDSGMDLWIVEYKFDFYLFMIEIVDIVVVCYGILCEDQDCFFEVSQCKIVEVQEVGCYCDEIVVCIIIM